MKRKKLQRILYLVTTISFIIPAIFLVLMMVLGESERMNNQSDAGFLLMQCLLGLVTINLPSLLERRMRFELPGLLYGF